MSDSTKIGDLVIQSPSVPPDLTVLEVGDLLLSDTYDSLLSLPIVEHDRPIGTISRYQMMKVLFKMYGRELHGKRAITHIMNARPVVVEADMELVSASNIILENIKYPVTEDFIIARDGAYLGMGVVMHLIQALQKQLATRSEELTRAYADLKASETQLIQSEKMASLGQMVAGVAHEINTPLGYVRNNVEIIEGFFQETRQLMQASMELTDLLTSADLDEQRLNERLIEIDALKSQFAYAGNSEDMVGLFSDTQFGIGQISKLVTGLKDFSRLDRAVADDVDVNECLDSALLLAHHVLKNKVSVVKRYAELPPVSCAPSELNQVFLNILTNAAHAIETEGTVLLETEADDGLVHIHIEDTGKGIPADVLPKIFDPFFTTKPVGQGTGLGLSISYKIIEQHGGRINVTSQVGKGTRFMIALPAAAPALLEAGHG